MIMENNTNTHFIDKVVTALRKSAFIDYMKSLGKLGGQNKVPRLSNDRAIAEELLKFAQ